MILGNFVSGRLNARLFLLFLPFRGREPISVGSVLHGLETDTILVSMKCLLTVFLLSVCHLGLAETPVLTADESIPIPKVTFDAKGDLAIAASPASSPKDFDFLVGNWKMHNRHLNKRLENCKEWTEFDSSDENTKILAGNADMDTYSTTGFPGQEGKLFEVSPCGSSIPKPVCGVCIGSRAIPARSTLP